MTQCEVILCVWHVRRAWLKKVNNLATSPDMASAMFSKLGYIMKYCSNDDVTATIQGFFNEFVGEGKFLDYLNKNWFSDDKFRKYRRLFLVFLLKCFMITIYFR